MVTRRQFLTSGFAGGAGLVIPIAYRGPRGKPVHATPAVTLRRYVDPLPRPGVLTPVSYDGTTPVYHIAVSEFHQTLHSDLPPTRLWGYAGSYPGPTIEARTGEPLRVVWSNELGVGRHLLPVDRTLHGTDAGEPDRRIVTHLHGGIVPPDADGFPEAWITFGQTADFLYPNTQRAATLWYHDHSLAITRLNVMAGMAAFYLLRDDEEEALVAQGLPAGEFEIPIVIQDRAVNPDGSLFYPSSGVSALHPVWVPEFFGDLSVVNGVAFPVLQVQPRKYRFRLLNGCNSRFLNLQLLVYENGRYRADGPPLVMIGSDGGLLPRPVVLARDGRGRLPERHLMAPAERADVIVDFSRFAGQDLVLHNNAGAPFSGSAPGNARPPVHRHGHPIGADLSEIMLLRVSGAPVSESGSIPAVLSPSFERLDERAAVVERTITLVEVLDADGVPLEALINDQHWDQPITEHRIFGTTEIWYLVNLTEDTHPIHLHLDHFQVLWRRSINTAVYLKSGELRWQGPEVPPAPEEAGWKDTVSAHPGEVTAIIMRSDSYRGIYPYHCHILEHEDNEMMLRFEVF